MNLEQIIANNPDLTGWFRYEVPGVQGLELEIAYVDPDQLAELERRHGGLEKEKRDEYVSAFIRRALRGWRDPQAPLARQVQQDLKAHRGPRDPRAAAG